MYKDRLHVVLNHSEKISKRENCFFGEGETKNGLHHKIKFEPKVYSRVVFRMNVLSSSSKATLVSEAKKADPKRDILICFNGSDADFDALKSSLKGSKNAYPILVNSTSEHIVNVYWDSCSRENYFCNILSIESKKAEPVKTPAPSVEKKEKPKTPAKENNANANVNLQKPNNDKKTNK